MYLKELAGNNKFIITRLTDENVFSICPVCGEEHQIDLTDLTGRITMESDEEPITLQVCCRCCTMTVREKGLNAILMRRAERLSYSLKLKGKEDNNECL